MIHLGTDVLMDVALYRRPHTDRASELLDRIEHRANAHALRLTVFEPYAYYAACEQARWRTKAFIESPVRRGCDD